MGRLPQSGFIPVGENRSAYTLDWFFVNRECVERLPLPTYSPFLNPLEEVFSVWKQEYINRIRSSSHVKDAEELIVQCAPVVTTGVCQRCFDHMVTFIHPSLKGLDITTHEQFEKSHEGDEYFVPFEELLAPHLRTTEEDETE